MTRFLAVAALVALVPACGNERPSAPDEQPLVTYATPRDGVEVSYPSSWHRFETPVAPVGTPSVQVLALSTAELNPTGGCAPYPTAALAQLGEGDLLFVLSVSTQAMPGEDGSVEQRPADLPEPEADPPDGSRTGCVVDGIHDRQVAFWENGQHYTALLATRGALSNERRGDFEAMWDSLVLSPIGETAGAAAPGVEYWHVLYTHCGIRGTRFDGRDWVADPPAHDGSGNPPPHWGNPTQPGHIVLQGASATFTSRDGTLRAIFRERAPSDPPESPCA